LIPNIFKIQRVKLEGEWTFDYQFNNGLNAVITANKHGKTSLLKIIFRTLGFADKRPEELKKKVSKVHLEIEINEKKFVIQMITEGRKSKLQIAEGKQIENVKKRDFQSISGDKLQAFLEEELGLIPYNYRDPLNKKNKLNNLRQAYRAFYLLQNHANEIISNWTATDIRRNVIQSWLRHPDKSNQFEDKSTDYNSQINDLKKELESIKRNINKNIKKVIEICKELYKKDNSEDLDFKEKEFLTDVKKDLDRLIESKKIEKKRSKDTLANFFKGLNENERFIKIDKEIADIENKIEEKNKKRYILEFNFQKLENKKTFQKEYLLELKNKLDIKDYKIPLKILNPSTACDRCGRDITKKRYIWEKETPPKCALCGRERDENFIKLDILEKRYKSTEEMISKLDLEFNKQLEKTKELYSQIDSLKNKYKEKNKEKEKLKQELINEKISSIFKKIEVGDESLLNLNEQNIILKSLINDVEEIPELEEKIKSKKKEKREYDPNFHFNKKVKDDWLRFIQEFIKEVLLEDREEKRVEISPSTYLPIIDERGWRDLVESEQHIFNLAMYYSFLKCSLIHNIKFPRFLLWDCWKTGELDEWKSKRICKLLLELHKQYKDNFQMIITTADRVIMDFIPKENILTREDSENKEEYLFLENEVISYSKPKK
jgi:hypothetical protein